MEANNNCNLCVFFSYDYNQLCKKNDCKVKLDSDIADKNYCHFYEKGIDKNIWCGLKQCENYTKKISNNKE